MFLFRKWFQLSQWQQIMIGLILGICAGFILKAKAEYLLPIGTMFIHAIQMLVVPVVMTAIVCAVVSLKELDKMGRMVVKALVLYGFTMAIAATIGIIVANALGVGLDFPMDRHAISSVIAPQKLTLGEIFIS